MTNVSQCVTVWKFNNSAIQFYVKSKSWVLEAQSYNHRGSQCGNFRNFLPLRFYVKSKLANLDSHSTISTHWESLNFWTFWRLKTKLTKSKVPKIAVLEYLVSSKLISRKIWVVEKLWNFHTVMLKFTKNTILKLWVSLYWFHVKQFFLVS